MSHKSFRAWRTRCKGEMFFGSAFAVGGRLLCELVIAVETELLKAVFPWNERFCQRKWHLNPRLQIPDIGSVYTKSLLFAFTCSRDIVTTTILLQPPYHFHPARPHLQAGSVRTSEVRATNRALVQIAPAAQEALGLCVSQYAAQAGKTSRAGECRTETWSAPVPRGFLRPEKTHTAYSR